jgi:hypothetical protein
MTLHYDFLCTAPIASRIHPLVFRQIPRNFDTMGRCPSIPRNSLAAITGEKAQTIATGRSAQSAIMLLTSTHAPTSYGDASVNSSLN